VHLAVRNRAVASNLHNERQNTGHSFVIGLILGRERSDRALSCPAGFPELSGRRVVTTAQEHPTLMGTASDGISGLRLERRVRHANRMLHRVQDFIIIIIIKRVGMVFLATQPGMREGYNFCQILRSFVVSVKVVNQTRNCVTPDLRKMMIFSTGQ
jgi:hypothetical protein